MARIVVQPGLTHKNMVVFPVTLSKISDGTNYASLDEAIENGWIKITEVGSGSVPQLNMVVSSAKPMFMMAGEIVTGAKQDRILTNDLVFNGFTGTVALSVYCVEQGRWTVQSDSFGSGKILGANSVRKAAQEKEGQSTVWSAVNSENAKLGAVTSTDTMQATYKSEKFKESGSSYLEYLRNVNKLYNGQVVGAVVAIGGEVVSADIFANPQMFSKLWDKLLKASVVDAIDAGSGTVTDNVPAREFLGKASKGTIAVQGNPSQGWEFQVSTADIQGKFISYKQGLVHLSLFSGKVKPKYEPAREEMQFQNQQNQQIQQQQQFR
jgi:hypothetical protein